MVRIVAAVVFAAAPLWAAAQTPAPSASPSAAPSPLPSPLPTPLVLPPQAAPQILAVRVNEPFFHSGDMVEATVITSTNVPAVELRILGKVIRFQRLDFGVFQLAYKLPHIPRRFLKDYAGQIVAMNTQNMYVAQNITISLR